MTNATYVQRGETLDYVNETAKLISAGSVVIVGDRIGVAGCPIAPGETGVLHVTGVFEIAKTGTAAIEIGKAVFFDGAGITGTASESGEAATVPAGYAAASAAANAATVLVKLTG